MFTPAKCVEKDAILNNSAGQRPVSLIKISLFQRCFSHILLVEIKKLVSQ